MATAVEGEGGITEEKFVALMESFSPLLNGEVCDLLGEGIGNYGAIAIGVCLVEAECTELNLEMNDIRDQGGMEIGKGLEVNSTLRTLVLSNNRIGTKGVGQIANALKRNTCLKELYLDSNDISTLGAKGLAQALAVNNTLTVLSLNWNKLAGAAKQLGKHLATNKSLRILKLGYCEIDDEGATELAAALKRNSALELLDLHWNKISSEGGKALAEALGKNSTLQRLNLFCNNLSDNNKNPSTTGDAFISALQMNDTIIGINLLDNGINDDLLGIIDIKLTTNAELNGIPIEDDEDEDSEDGDNDYDDDVYHEKKYTESSLEEAVIGMSFSSDEFIAGSNFRDFAKSIETSHQLFEQEEIEDAIAADKENEVDTDYSIAVAKTDSGKDKDKDKENKVLPSSDVKSENADDVDLPLHDKDDSRDDESVVAIVGKRQGSKSSVPHLMRSFTGLSTRALTHHKFPTNFYHPGGVLGYTTAVDILKKIDTTVTLVSIERVGMEAEKLPKVYESILESTELPDTAVLDELLHSLKSLKIILWHMLHALTDQGHDSAVFEGYYNEFAGIFQVGRLVMDLINIILVAKPVYYFLCFEVYLLLLKQKGNPRMSLYEKSRKRKRDSFEKELEDILLILNYQNFVSFMLTVSGAKDMLSYYIEQANAVDLVTQKWPEQLSEQFPKYERNIEDDMRETLQADRALVWNNACVNVKMIGTVMYNVREYIHLVDFSLSCGRVKEVEEHVTELLMNSGDNDNEASDKGKPEKMNATMNKLKQFFFFSGDMQCNSTRLSLQIRRPLAKPNTHVLAAIAASDFLQTLNRESVVSSLTNINGKN